jgi:hypothetical protein
MVNNSTNINKMNNHLSSQLIEHKKRLWNDVGNSVPVLGHGNSVPVLGHGNSCPGLGQMQNRFSIVG